ncbi:MAG TPA: NADPH:quinone reductase [Steroidobacter sp.]|jgi:NADPH2:quinone reductase|nr:NADPH:quinone reductase [Steroidobacter sp.]
MRAAIYERTGTAREVLQIVEAPTPEPGPGEVRVKLAWSGVNPSDVKTRAGVRSRTLAFAHIIPHSDGAGEIDAVGAGVSEARVGERVWTWNAAWGRPFGTAAQYVVLPSEQAVPLPQGVDLAAGACLGIPALTAWHAVSVDGGVAEKSILIAGGAGAVGHYAIQIARELGARQILTTVSSPEKAALARAAGADATIDYRREDVPARIHSETGGCGVDRIIEVDFGANVALDVQIVRPGGDIVVYGSAAPEVPVPFVPMITKHLRLRFFIVYTLSAHDRMQAIEGVTSMLSEGRLTHNLAERLPLERIAEAHELVESGRAVGNVVIRIE